MMKFPCYDCEHIGDETPRCKAFETCDKWQDWRKTYEHNESIKIQSEILQGVRN